MEERHAQLIARIKDLHAEYRQVHREGMRALESHDWPRLDVAIRRERDLILAKMELLNEFCVATQRRVATRRKRTPPATARHKQTSPLHTVEDEREEREVRVAEILEREQRHKTRAAKALADGQQLKAEARRRRAAAQRKIRKK